MILFFRWTAAAFFVFAIELIYAIIFKVIPGFLRNGMWSEINGGNH
ncbi:hypothetical protein CLOSTHATH_04294 [Hungatella hathewayi DSM 13479]|uniref:Uncharacterized protein n=1 Tax=Hungatella hathewayi DSM 13479 TaxID=566550 RepID=D3AL00_9FIRM|nr:hypothetical protein CLOSTHATH_04294 [Hungatella hathewayi DSM 13479]